MINVEKYYSKFLKNMENAIQNIEVTNYNFDYLTSSQNSRSEIQEDDESKDIHNKFNLNDQKFEDVTTETKDIEIPLIDILKEDNIVLSGSEFEGLDLSQLKITFPSGEIINSTT